MSNKCKKKIRGKVSLLHSKQHGESGTTQSER